MISLMQAAQFCKAIYRPVTPAVFDQVYGVDDVNVGYKLLGDTNVFAFAGSESFEDWIRDFDALPQKTPLLNATVHRGMFRGVGGTFAMLKSIAINGKKNAIVGHSLGGAHAAYFAAFALKAGATVDLLVGFEMPKAGYADLSGLLAGVQAKYVTKNGTDVVPELPLTTEDFPYEHFAQVTPLDDPAPFDCIDPFPDHSIDRVIAGVGKLKTV